MTRQEYMGALRESLMGMPEEEKENIIEYYTEYFEEAGPEKESEVMEDLGSPRSLGIKLSGESALKSMNEAEAARNADGESSMKQAQQKAPAAGKNGSVWKTVLIVLAIIIGSPLVLPAAIIALVLVIVVIAVIVSLAASAIAVIIAGAFAFFVGIAAIIGGAFTEGILAIGVALVTMGIAILGVMLIILMVKGIRKLILHIGNRRLGTEVPGNE